VSLDRPVLLLSLLVVPAAVGLYLLAERRRMRYALRFTNLDVLARIGAGSARRRYVPPALLLVALALLSVALARPHVDRVVTNERATVILVIDASRSMQAQDVRPTRLAAAQAAARTFLDRVPKRLRVALIVFTGDVQVAAPPTTDHQLVRQSIDEIGTFMSFGGTAIGDAIARAVELAQEALAGDRTLASIRSAAPSRGRARGLVSIVFLSDGRQNRGVIPPLEGAALAAAAGIPVYTIALGTPNGAVRGRSGFGFGRGFRAVPDPATLRRIARMTGGEFFEARTAKSASAAYAKLGTRLGRSPGRSEVTFAFVLGAAAFLVAAGLLSARWSPRLP
jgi:Ca-activated chloride channel family protein